MQLATSIGIVAGFLTTLAFVPQVVRTWRTRRCDDVSLAMLVAFSIGVALWLVYGIILGAAAIILSNGVTLVLALALCAMKVRFSGSASQR